MQQMDYDNRRPFRYASLMAFVEQEIAAGLYGDVTAFRGGLGPGGQHGAYGRHGGRGHRHGAHGAHEAHGGPGYRHGGHGGRVGHGGYGRHGGPAGQEGRADVEAMEIRTGL